MIFEVPDELYEQPLLCCANCGNPVPNNMLDVAQAGMLGPCPNCGSEELMDNPNTALAYSKTSEYPYVMGLLFVEDLFTYFRFIKFVPTIDTEKRKRHLHPVMAALEDLRAEK